MSCGQPAISNLQHTLKQTDLRNLRWNQRKNWEVWRRYIFRCYCRPTANIKHIVLFRNTVPPNPMPYLLPARMSSWGLHPILEKKQTYRPSYCRGISMIFPWNISYPRAERQWPLLRPTSLASWLRQWKNTNRLMLDVQLLWLIYTLWWWCMALGLPHLAIINDFHHNK